MPLFGTNLTKRKKDSAVPMMRVLMICTKYPLDPSDRYMTNELASALVVAGHRVQVVVTEWDAQFGDPTISTRSDDGVDILAVAPWAIMRLGRFFRTASKWMLSSLFARREMQKALGTQSFDTLICFSPCITVWAQLLWAIRRWQMRSILFVHDFFPYHHHSIGLVPGGAVFRAAQLMEQKLIRGFDVVCCNWPSNIVYLKSHYRIRPEQHIIWTPLWAEVKPVPRLSKRSVRATHDLPQNKKIVVFGGQITEGRGVEDILDAAAIAQVHRPEIIFLLIGDGRLVPKIERQIAAGSKNLILRRRVPRDEYVSVLGACDVGLVATVTGVDSSSFPTKTIDYLRAALPIVAAVEKESDYRSFLDSWKIGSSISVGDATALYEAIVRTVDADENDVKHVQRAANCLEQVFDVKKAVELCAKALARP
jgi:glycosyltransferase involved in cell wall biosynthesis